MPSQQINCLLFWLDCNLKNIGPLTSLHLVEFELFLLYLESLERMARYFKLAPNKKIMLKMVRLQSVPSN